MNSITHDIKNKVKGSEYKKRVKTINAALSDIEKDVLLYNKLTEEQRVKFLAGDPLLSAFITLAAKVKR